MSDDNMVERVAKAIGDSLHGHVDAADTPNTWRASLELARVAIAATGEPIEAEREACAKIAEACKPPGNPYCPDDWTIGWKDCATEIAASIRARGTA